MSGASEGLQRIERSRRYQLVAGPDFYGVLDVERGDLERFPETDEGFDAAQERFRELRRLRRRERWRPCRILVVTVAVGAAVWLVGGLLVLAAFWLGPVPELLLRVGEALDAFGFRLVLGSLAVVVALVVVRPTAMPAVPQGERLSTGPATRVLVGVMIAALVVWVAAGVALLFVSPFGGAAVSFPGGFVESLEPSRGYEMVQTISSVAFRFWVGCLLLLALLWVPRLAPGGRLPDF